MILDSLVIQNIRSYPNQEIEFSPGITLFTGNIGSGKSTILMAIEFALFGLGSQKGESLLSKGAESGYAILEFSIDGQMYEIKRSLKRSQRGVNHDTRNSWAKVGGEMQPLSSSELKQKILQILGFNEPVSPNAESRIYRYAVFTPQESMKEVLSDARKRLETIRKAFRIEDYAIAKSNATSVLGTITQLAQLWQERFSDIPELQQQVLDSTKEISQAQGKADEITDQKEAEEDVEKQLIYSIGDLRVKKEHRTRLESQRDSLEGIIHDTSSQIQQSAADLKGLEQEMLRHKEHLGELQSIKKPQTILSASEIEAEIKRIRALNEERIRYDSEKKSLLHDISNLNRHLDTETDVDRQGLESQLHDLLDKKTSLQKSVNDINTRLNEIREQKASKQALKDGASNDVEEFEKLGNTCPTCKQDITSAHRNDLVGKKLKQVASLETDLKQITDSFFESGKALKDIEVELESYNSDILQIQKILPRIEEHEQKSLRLSAIEDKLGEIKDSVGDQHGQNPLESLSLLRDEVAKFDNAADQTSHVAESMDSTRAKISDNHKRAKKLEAKATEQRSQLADITSQLPAFAGVNDEISRLESEQDTHRKEISRLSGLIAALNQRIKDEQEKIASNEEKIAKSKKWQEKFELLSEVREWFEKFFIPVVSHIERQVMISVLQNFNETYTRLYSSLVEDPTKESSIDEDFKPVVQQDGYEQDVAYLSGGEKTSIALAYRLTLNSLMRKEIESIKSGLLILDEPTDGFSKSQLNKMMDLFAELRSEQIILVSHDPELGSLANRTFSVVKSNGVSGISPTKQA